MDPKAFETLRKNLAFDDNGTLSLGEQPMMLIPRHFFCFIMENVEKAAGPQGLTQVYAKAGYAGAVKFCQRFQEVHKTTARAAVQGYFDEMSVRGWGEFRIAHLDEAALTMEVVLVNPATKQAQVKDPYQVCASFVEGAVEFLAESQGKKTKCVGRQVESTKGDPPNSVRYRAQPQ